MQHHLTTILEEIDRQNTKWGEQNHSPIEWSAILSEEVGEMSKAALSQHFNFPVPENQKDDFWKENYKEELVQIAALALQMLSSFERNEEKKS